MIAKGLTRRITIAIHMEVGHGGAGMEFIFVHLIVMLSGYIIPNWMYYIDYVEGKNP